MSSPPPQLHPNWKGIDYRNGVPPQSIPLGLYLCRVESPDEYPDYVPTRTALIKAVQSYYQGKEDWKHLENCINGSLQYKSSSFGLDIYRIKFNLVSAQKSAEDNFTHMFDTYDGSYNDHWFVFTE